MFLKGVLLLHVILHKVVWVLNQIVVLLNAHLDRVLFEDFDSESAP